MSDEHDEYRGAHEVDRVPHARLLALLVGFAALAVLACLAVIQLFNMQVAQVEDQRARRGSFRHQAYRAEQDAVRDGHGTVKVREFDGKETDRFYIPLAQARTKVLEDPQLLNMRPAYPGWEKTDTAKAIAEQGGRPQAAPVGAPRKGGGETP